MIKYINPSVLTETVINRKTPVFPKKYFFLIFPQITYQSFFNEKNAFHFITITITKKVSLFELRVAYVCPRCSDRILPSSNDEFIDLPLNFYDQDTGDKDLCYHGGTPLVGRRFLKLRQRKHCDVVSAVSGAAFLLLNELLVFLLFHPDLYGSWKLWSQYF